MDLLHEHRRAQALATIYAPRRASAVVPQDMEVFCRHAAAHIGSDEPIDYLEFGVPYGYSMRRLTNIFTNPNARFFGFDNFVGLPEDWLTFKAGTFTNNGNAPDIADQRVRFVKGWFQNSLPVFLADYHPQAKVLVNFDSDLYSSALFVLTQLWGSVPEYYFFFDEFMHHECIALYDFAAAFPIEMEFIAQTAGGGDPPVPAQVFGRMRRVPMVVRD